MTATLLVTGGTGTLGRAVIPMLTATGRDLKILSRRAGSTPTGVETVVGDLSTGDGVPAALHGVRTVLHLAGSTKGDGEKARQLVRAAQRAGIEHIVFISVVGAERVPVRSAVDRALFGYFAAKREAEQVIEQSGLGWTTLRATQFHDLVWMTAAALATLPVVPVPRGVRFQPVETTEVAARLVELAAAPPAGLVADLAGPQVWPLADLVRSYLRATGRRRALVPLPVGGAAVRAIRAGANLSPDHATGNRTWTEYLADRVAGTGRVTGATTARPGPA